MPISGEMKELIELLKLARKDRATDEQLDRLEELKRQLRGELFPPSWDAEPSAA